MWWSYIVTFIGSLVVAMASVWVAQNWSAKRKYKRQLQNLKAEILANIRVCNLICEWVDRNKEALAEGQLVVASCPHFYNMGWVEVKGALYTSDYKSAVELEDLYMQIGVMNDLLVTMEELKWGAGAAMTGTEVRRKTVLGALREVVAGIISPKLQEEAKLVDSFLKSRR